MLQAMQTALQAGTGGGSAFPTGPNTVPITQDGTGKAQLTPVLPIELQGVLDERQWEAFAASVNARLEKEFEETKGVAGSLGPLKYIGCVMFVALPVLFVGGALGFIPEVPFFILPLLAFGAMILMVCAGCKVGQGVIATQAESMQFFEQINQQYRSQNPQVSLQVMQTKVLAGTSNGRARYRTIRYVQYGVAGSAAGMLAPQQQAQNFSGMPAATPMLGAQPGMVQMGGFQPGTGQMGGAPGMQQFGGAPGMQQFGGAPGMPQFSGSPQMQQFGGASGMPQFG